MKKQKSNISNVIYIIIIIILLSVIFKVYQIYKKYNFNDFTKAVYTQKESNFSRDGEIKYSDKDSYKIESLSYNDAMFFKEIDVEPNTPYKVTCMVKVKNVKAEKDVIDGGAQICISDTLEKSRVIQGTQDWQKIELIFNSKNRESVNIGFRLGGNDENCMGTAWFSDFTLETGTPSDDNKWNFACFLIKNVNVSNSELNINTQMTNSDIESMKQNMNRFKSSCESLSQNQIVVNYNIIEIDDVLTTLTKDKEYGYYIDANDIEKIIDKYIKENEYDHIFVCAKLGNDIKNSKDNDWIGLGSMEYYGIGFSNIRLPGEEKEYIYKYNSRINTFPEEVFIHEFLHSLEKIANENGYERPALHDYEKYGYKNEKREGLRKWYGDYMTSNIKYNGSYIGLPKEVYKIKPCHNSDFKYSYKIDEFKEPQNILDDIRNIFMSFLNAIDKTTINKENIDNVEI